jgi:hypothetical protein
MTKSTLLFTLFGALFVVGLAIVPARAQATRTWVSGVGDDANPCSRTAPCKTWAGAISKTAPGGEMDALDPGGFGALTITKSITIDGGSGQVASVLTEGTPGITISAASNDAVIIRNLRFDGLLGNGSSPGTAGTIGVNIRSGQRVVLENNDIFGFGNGSAGTGGIVITPSTGAIYVDIINTTAFNNQVGLLSKPTGGSQAYVAIDHSHFDSNAGAGVRIDGTGGGTSFADITASTMSVNQADGVIAVSATGGTASINMMQDVVHGNSQFGIASNQAAGGTAVVVVGQSMVSDNVAGALSATGGASLASFITNQLVGAPGTGFTGGLGLQ